MTSTESRRRLRFALVVFAAATVAGLYFATQARFGYAMMMTVPWKAALGVNLTSYYLWALAVPVVVALARRFPLESRRWWLHLPAHALASIVVTLVQLSALELVVRALHFRSHKSESEYSVLDSIRVNFHGSLPTYWLILFAWWTWEYYRRYRDREVRALELEAELTNAQLDALRAQLNPHFLFNVLHSISSLMYSDVEAADRMMARLSDLLRLTLEKSSQELSLREEIEILERYLEIERIRFEERLAVTIDADESVLGARVPAFSLQPLVENSLRHAIASRESGGKIAIRAVRDDGILRVSVRDDGPGMSDVAPRRGVGLSNVRARMERLYGDRQSVVLSDAPGGGLVVELTLPYREAAT
jgi:signal transduction histidine kinase